MQIRNKIKISIYRPPNQKAKQIEVSSFSAGQWCLPNSEYDALKSVLLTFYSKDNLKTAEWTQTFLKE